VAVDGLAGDVEGFGDLGDGVAAFPVTTFLVIHLCATPTWRAASLGLRPPVRPRARVRLPAGLVVDLFS
jgi:hypothetical protein